MEEKRVIGPCFMNHATYVANINCSVDNKSFAPTTQAAFCANQDIPSVFQLLFDYRMDYFSRVDYSPVYLHPKDSWKTPAEHYFISKKYYYDTY